MSTKIRVGRSENLLFFFFFFFLKHAKMLLNSQLRLSSVPETDRLSKLKKVIINII